jgi:stress response protein SCP2
MSITLAKGDEAADLNGVEKLNVGAAWDASSGNSGRIMGKLRKAKGTDLDLIAVAMVGGEPKRLAGLDSLNPFGNGSLIHTGDAFTGAADGDDELTEATFANFPGIVTSVVWVVSAFKPGNKFTGARNVAFNVYDATGGRPEKVAEIWPSLLGTANACAVAKAYKTPAGSWLFEVIEEFGTIRQGDDQSLMRFAAQYAQ